MGAYLVRDGGPPLTLRDEGVNRVGRDPDCEIALSDPASSRVHAEITRVGGTWRVRDAASRNGVFVNGRQVAEAELVDHCQLRIGSTVFFFHETPEPRAAAPVPFEVAQHSSDPQSTPLPRPVELADPARAADFLQLHQLGLRLWNLSTSDEMTRRALEFLRDRVKASVAGCLWLAEDGVLRPKLVLGADDASTSAANTSAVSGVGARLSQSLTRLVCEERRAAWLETSNATGKEGEAGKLDAAASLRALADAMCAPLLRGEAVYGALHLYRHDGRFQKRDFDLLNAAAPLLAAALARADREASLRADHQRLALETAAASELLGDSPPMRDLKLKIARVARAQGAVLLRGESGSGKELVARALHQASARADRPMLSVNCAAIPAELMESQLFGHKKGAFTGADRDHAGWFQQAHTGTLFLDEIGELTLPGQAKLLRVLEGHPFFPVGDQTETRVDVRVLAATHRDLREFVKEKRFREDLFYRLGVFELAIPPLRQRGADIGLLIDYFFDHFRRGHGRLGLTLSPEARAKLEAYAWPGNVRQLRNVLDSAIVLAEGPSVTPRDLGLHDVGAADAALPKLADAEKKLLEEALRRAAGDVVEAAKLLGVTKQTLARKLEEHGLKK